MRYIFYFWFLPMSLFWAWFGLSYYDINMGTDFFSREMNELVFAIYGSILGLERETIVWLVVRACIVDTILIFAIFGFRKRHDIKAWWQARREKLADNTDPAQPLADPAE